MLRAVFALCALALMSLDAAPGKWTDLYNRRDLSGWHVEGKGAKLELWTADGEILKCAPGPGGYLATNREYSDFELSLEYRIYAGANSGVGLRFPRGGWPSTDGMEIQILDDDAPEHRSLHADQYNGAIYAHHGPRVRAARRLGEWNRLEIRLKGPSLLVRLNGRTLHELDLDTETSDKGKGRLPLAQRPRSGLIGLQSHGSAVEFRRVRLRELQP